MVTTRRTGSDLQVHQVGKGSLPRRERVAHRLLRDHPRHRYAPRRSPRPALARHRPRQPHALVRYTLSSINNATPTFTTPKTRSSHAWIGLSARVVAALQRQRDRQDVQRRIRTFRDQDLVFTRADGQPLRPEYVLRHLHRLTDEADLPRVRVHDLRHFAATTMLSSQVPVAMASKTMRHSTLSTTTEVYGHLLPQVAFQAVDAIDNALTAAENQNPVA